MGDSFSNYRAGYVPAAPRATPAQEQVLQATLAQLVTAILAQEDVAAVVLADLLRDRLIAIDPTFVRAARKGAP